eukprot:1698852-Rhodomonas_salina.4
MVPGVVRYWASVGARRSTVLTSVWCYQASSATASHLSATPSYKRCVCVCVWMHTANANTRNHTPGTICAEHAVSCI